MTKPPPEQPNRRDDDATGLALKTRQQLRPPSLYKVLLLNDDFTPMDFVVGVLESIFNKSHAEATQIMLQVHQQGSGLCGIYTYEIAETKQSQVMVAARHHQHPLQCKLEKE
jgi:ATP-dependent Clp protease adaptor protein ClpS